MNLTPVLAKPKVALSNYRDGSKARFYSLGADIS
jgi:hypothetical protein